MKEKIKRHLISFAITFVAMFAMLIAPALYVDSISYGILLAAILAAARSAFKIAWEIALLPLSLWLIEWSKKNLKTK